MKNLNFWLFVGLLVPYAAFGAGGSDFQNATQLLSAARRGDTQTVQKLVNSGVDVNYVDSTGMSVVCTAVMNNDKTAIQILQRYGADASNCDKQIKQYKQKTKVAASGEEYGFFSGLSSSHIVALSAVGIAGVVGGVALLTDAFGSENNNNTSSSGGSHGSGSGGNTSDSASVLFTVPYGPAYLTSDGTEIDTSFNIDTNLAYWDLTNVTSVPTLQQTDFRYLKTNVAGNYVSAGLNPMLENYLLDMGGYYSFASYYMGQNIFRDKDKSYMPMIPAIENVDAGRPVRVALVTGNGINPAGSADSKKSDSETGITYAVSTASNAETNHVDKYINNIAEPVEDTNGVVVKYKLSEQTGFDLSESGSAFNPFADVNDSALAKIVAGWNGGRASNDGDLYGFVPQGQLAIYRTGNGKVWQDLSSPVEVGTWTPGASGVLAAGDTVTIGSYTYTISNAVDSGVTQPIIEVNNTKYKVASTSKMFVGECTDTSSGCTDIALYVGTDGYWYVNSKGNNDIDSVYSAKDGKVYQQKKLATNAAYTNFSAMALAKVYKAGTEQADIIANTNVIPASRKDSYVTINNFTKAANNAKLTDYYQYLINDYYGGTEGGIANSLFLSYSPSAPMIIMPAGDYLYKDKISGDTYFDTLAATFENYAPILYADNLQHNFITVVGVAHADGTNAADTIIGYGNGTGSGFGKIRLSLWYDNFGDFNDSNWYSSRMCGVAGIGNPSAGIDPWCFAAAGPTAEMATAAAAGAVASLKSAFSYMSNNQIFTLLALTADGPFLNANTDGTRFTEDSLAEYLQNMYEIPGDLVPVGGIASLSSSEYLNLFKQVYGYGLINLRRAIQPGFSVYYYDSDTNNIVSSTGSIDKFWGQSSSQSRSSSALSLTGRNAVTVSFYDVIESVDGTLSLPRVWKNTFALDAGDNKHGLYMGDVLGDFNVDSTNKHSNQIGNLTIDMAMSTRAYDDNLNGLDNMRIAWTNDSFDLVTEYQHHLTDGESRFNGRANGLLGLVSNAISANTMYKTGRFGFGGRAFVGAVTDENLLDTDPIVSSQFEPGRLGLSNGGSFDTKYFDDRFSLNVSLGVIHENNTVLGMVSDGLLAMNNADTKYIDAVTTYKPFDNVKLSLRGTFATTNADNQSEFISELSNIKSNAFAFGVDIGRFDFTFALPLAVVDGKLGYGYADFEVVENDGRYEVAVNNAHTEYLDLSAQKRELRFSTSYKHALGDFTDAGVGFIYRVNPNNTDVFGNESILMFKLHHRLGI